MTVATVDMRMDLHRDAEKLWPRVAQLATEGGANIASFQGPQPAEAFILGRISNMATGQSL